MNLLKILRRNTRSAVSVKGNFRYGSAAREEKYRSPISGETRAMRRTCTEHRTLNVISVTPEIGFAPKRRLPFLLYAPFLPLVRARALLRGWLSLRRNSRVVSLLTLGVGLSIRLFFSKSR